MSRNFHDRTANCLFISKSEEFFSGNVKQLYLSVVINNQHTIGHMVQHS
jgi:hypothetical protein